jgi:hypothetical protein
VSHRRQTLVIFAIAIAICVPFFHYVAWLGDEGILLNAARRMMRGEHIYRDFFEFMQPLGFLITYGWFKIFGDSFFGCRVLAIATLAIAASASFVASRTVSRAAFVSGTMVVIWLLGSQGNWTVVSHRWFALAFSMPAAALLLSALERERDPLRVLFCGLCVGAALVTTAPPGGLVGVACLASLLLGRRPLVEIIALAIGGAIVPSLTAGWMIRDGVMGDAARTAFAFLAHRYAGVQSVPFAHDADRQSYLLVIAFPLAGVLFIHARAALRTPSARAAFCFALAGFASCFPRPDVAHICFALPLAIPFLAWAIARLVPLFTESRWLWGSLLLLPILNGYLGRVGDVGANPAVNGVRFGSGTQPEEVAVLFAEITALPPNDALFFYPYEPMLIYLTGRRHAAPVELFTPNYTWPSQYRQSCESAIRDAAWVVIDRSQVDAAQIQKTWPHIGNANPPEKVAFERAIEDSYSLVRRTPRYELRKRNPDASLEVCKTIGGES